MSTIKKGIDYIGVAVGLYGVFDYKGNVLLIKRSKNARDEHGRWDCVGGGMKFGETFEEAAKRELMEEVGVHAKDLKLCGINNVLREHEGAKTHWVCLIFSATVDPKEVKINEPEKIDDIGWFSPNNLPQPLHSMYLKHFEFVKNCSATVLQQGA